MAHHVPARLSREQNRRFGVQVGAVFVVLAAVAAWRGGAGVAALAVIGVGLMAAGLFAPAILGPVYRGWMGLALLLSKLTTPVFLGVIYFGVIAPIGLLMRAVGRSPLISGQGWVQRSSDPTPARMHRQF